VLRRARGLGTFVAEAPADGGRSDGAISLVLPSMSGIVHLRTFAGAQEAVAAHGCRLVVAHSDLDPAREARQIAAAARTVGLLLWPIGGATDRAALAPLHAGGVPCVFLDRYLDDVVADRVLVDDIGGAHDATTHLAALGHRRIAFLHYQDVDVSSERLRRDGYRRALGERGIPFDPELVLRHPTLPDPADLAPMAALARRLLALPSPPTAAFCVNDHVAQALLVVLHRQGVPVPSRFSIAGFDGLEYMPTPQRLTTVRRPTETMGREAVRLLLARLGDEPEGPPRHVVLPTELRVGETTAAAPRGAVSVVARRRKEVTVRPTRT